MRVSKMKMICLTNLDYIVILVCDNIPNQKFWNAQTRDWTYKFEEATIYATYGASVQAIWDIPEEKVTARVTSLNKDLYYLMLTKQWDGYSTLPNST